MTTICRPCVQAQILRELKTLIFKMESNSFNPTTELMTMKSIPNHRPMRALRLTKESRDKISLIPERQNALTRALGEIDAPYAIELTYDTFFHLHPVDIKDIISIWGYFEVYEVTDYEVS